MEFAQCFPIWNKLTPTQQERLAAKVSERKVTKGTIVHGGSTECTGLLLIKEGQLRAHILSAEGREITLYRLFDMDMCLFSASCMMRSIQFDITIEAEKDTDYWLVPVDVYKNLMEQSAAVANYTNELMAARFTEVMWLMEQVMWKSFDKRLANFLLEEAKLEATDVLKLTHEGIAKHLGTAREVVTRMLRYFQSEGYIKQTRGTITIVAAAELKKLQD